MVDSEYQKKMSLLEENIKTKGENAYYYAHKRLFDDSENQQGIKIEGPGIITGGDPVLLGKQEKKAEVIKETKKFTKYIFYDDDSFATIKIELPEEIKTEVSNENVDVKFTEKTLDVKVTPNNSEPYFFAVKKLHKKIVPEESKFKLSKGKLIINLKKKDEDYEWDNLNA